MSVSLSEFQCILFHSFEKQLSVDCLARDLPSKALEDPPQRPYMYGCVRAVQLFRYPVQACTCTGGTGGYF